ncbi:MAG: AraC family transcriptional regulator [Bacillota bacterium]|nr:AraC family transcriptional regulator [Bacillota bacterium]
MQGVRYYFNGSNENIEIKECSSALHSTKAHFHDEISVGLIERGECRSKIGGVSYEFKDKTLLVIPPEIVHNCSPYDIGQWDFKMLYINSQWFEDSFGVDTTKLSVFCKRLDNGSFAQIAEIFENMNEYRSSLEDEAEFLMKLSNVMSMNKVDREKDVTQGMRKLREYIHSNYLQGLMLEDLERVSGLSKYCLMREYKKHYGMSPHQYITALRINHSKAIMKKDISILEAALQSGFYDQSHFTKSFKKYLGLTPLAYKNSIKL